MMLPNSLTWAKTVHIDTFISIITSDFLVLRIFKTVYPKR